jgi:hypothetical protein
MHESHKSARCISETKRHHLPFIEASLGFECSLPLITFLDSDLMVSTYEINLGKDLRAMKLIQQVIKLRYRIPILDCDVVDGPAVYAHSHAAIFLRYKNHRYCTGAETFLHKTFVK